MPTPEQVRSAVDAYCAAYACTDRDAFLDAFTDDGVVLDPVGDDKIARVTAYWDMAAARPLG